MAISKYPKRNKDNTELSKLMIQKHLKMYAAQVKAPIIGQVLNTYHLTIRL